MSAASRVRDLVHPAPRTQNLAILLSDMKGFTARTSGQTREENARMLAFHDALLLPIIKGFGGHKVKSIGDALLVTFRSPTDCVLCGMAMQDRLAAWNAKAPAADAIEVRIAISLGEVRVESDDVTGDPVQLALRAGAHADAGEVVLTESVYLAMNKSEVPTEPFSVRELRPGESRLHRCRMSGPRTQPYAGRALGRLGRLRDPKLPLATRLLSFTARRWPVLTGFALLCGATAALVAVQMRRGRDPVLRAEQMLAAKAPLAALAELDKLSDAPQARSPGVQALRGKAEHALGQLGMAFADFAGAIDADPRVADAHVVRALVDDVDAEAFPLQWRPALVRVLGEKVRSPAADALRVLVSSPRARSRRDALEALELMGRATDADRIAVASADLADSSAGCSAVLSAVKTLTVAGNDRARELLRRTAAERRRCGAREARDALRRLERAVPTAKATALMAPPATPTATSAATASTATAIPTPASSGASSQDAAPSADPARASAVGPQVASTSQATPGRPRKSGAKKRRVPRTATR